MWPIWRIVRDSHISLSEVSSWSIDDVRRFNAVLDMQASYNNAARGLDMAREAAAKKDMNHGTTGAVR